MDAKEAAHSGPHRNWGKTAAQASLFTAIFAWLIGQAFKGPPATPTLEQAKLYAEIIRVGFYLGGALCALVAICSIRRFGREGILTAAMFGVFLNLGYLYVVGLSGAQRLYAREFQNTNRVVSVQTAQPGIPKAVVDYEAVEFYHLNAAREQAMQAFPRATGEDATVLQAWIATIDDWIALRAKVSAAEQRVATAAILEPATIMSTQSFVDRRQLANAWHSAANDWQNELHAVRARYARHLAAKGVSELRRGTELDRLHAGTPGSLKITIAHCATQKEVAVQLNHALNALQTEHAYWSVREGRSGGAFQVSPHSQLWRERMEQLSGALESLEHLRRELGIKGPVINLPAPPDPARRSEVVL